MAQYQTIKTSKKLTTKLSIAVGLLSFAAFVVGQLSQTWGFAEVGEQITQTALIFSGAINIFFLGDTTRKETERKNEESK